MRIGVVSPESEKILTSLSRELTYADGLEATQLFAIRQQVESANSLRLQSLSGEVHTFPAYDQAKHEYDKAKLKDMMALPVLELKVGAQVMLIKNIDEKLVNGSLGKVVGFEEKEKGGLPVVEFMVGGKKKVLVVDTETWTVEVPGLGSIASRTQVGVLRVRSSHNVCIIPFLYS